MRTLREVPMAVPTERASQDGVAQVEQRDELVRRLDTLSERERTVVVMRHYLDLSEAEVQYDDGTRWYRDVDVLYTEQTRGMEPHVAFSAYTDAPTWEQAREALPSVADLTALGLSTPPVLPAPDHYPVPVDAAEHLTTP